MIEKVATLYLAFQGIEVDKDTGSVAIYNISNSVNKHIKALSETLSKTCYMINSKAGIKKQSKKKESKEKASVTKGKGVKVKGFSLSANSFSILVFKDQVVIRYEFENNSSDLLQTQKQIVTEALFFCFDNYKRSFFEIESAIEMTDNEIFSVFGDNNIINYHKTLNHINDLSGNSDFSIEIDGYKSIVFDSCVPPPSLKKVFSKEKTVYQHYKIDGFRKTKRELYLVSANGRKKGRGDKVISVTIDQFEEINKVSNIILDDYVFNFEVEQCNFDKYSLLNFEVVVDPDLP